MHYYRYFLKTTLRLSQNKFKLIKYCGERKTYQCSLRSKIFKSSEISIKQQYIRILKGQNRNNIIFGL